MKKIRLLWADDEIDLLRAHVLFLEEKGYEVVTATNGNEAIQLVKSSVFDLVFLDEHMPGIGGLETLEIIKDISPALPVVMITKNEAEEIMDEAIGSRITDFLIKPVHPKQILLTIKKCMDQKRLVSEKTTSGYQSQFGEISRLINMAAGFGDWKEIYRRLVYWELELEKHGDTGMREVLRTQKYEANRSFGKYITASYPSWFEKDPPEKPLLSPGVFKQVVVPRLQNHEKILFILIDNLRLDQWKAMAPIFAEHLNIASEDLYCSILPTCTHYARNALFSGLMPLEIMKHHPDLWKFEDEPGSKNIHEGELLKRQLTRLGMNIPFRYEKVGNLDEGHKLVEQWQDMKAFSLNVVVYNFVDMVSHARTEVEMIKELAADEPAFRSLSLSWFRHSSLLDLIREISSEKFTLILTTDHGSIRVNNPIKVVGDRESSTNLRYKTGKNLNYNPREVFEVFDPEKIHLPKTQLTSRFIFARNDNFMVFPKNFNYYAGFFRNTFQHGGISLEEMMVPLVVLTPRS